MSATNRSDVRLPDDFYSTPHWTVWRLLDALHETVGRMEDLSKGLFLEPCIGDGAIVEAVNVWMDDKGLDLPRWTVVEKRDLGTVKHLHRDLHRGMTGDFLSDSTDLWLHEIRREELGSGRFHAVITNPPYSLAQEFLVRSLQHARWVIFLLRLNYLGSERRADFMRKYPPDVYVLPNRPSFTGQGKTDATEYSWCVWPPDRDRKQGMIRVLGSTLKEDR